MSERIFNFHAPVTFNDFTNHSGPVYIQGPGEPGSPTAMETHGLSPSPSETASATEPICPTAVNENVNANENADRPTFAYLVRAGHTEKQMAEVVEKISIHCGGQGSKLMSLLVDLEKQGYLYLAEAGPAEIYDELCKSFDMSRISADAIKKAYGRIG